MASSENSVLTIAEAGVNHNGSLALAKELVDAAVEAGADIVKFQTFKAENLVSRSTAKAGYQKRLTGDSESQFEMLRKLELSFDDFGELSDYCETKGIEFLSTAFDEECLDFLVAHTAMKRLKIPSGDITNGPLLLASARKKLPIILSSGMSVMGEVEEALDLIAFTCQEPSLLKSREQFRGAFRKFGVNLDVTLLHCTSEYPAAPSTLNLRAMQSLATRFSLPVGLSDHSQGILAPVVAVSMGASIVEKHFTLDKKLPGPDHQASLDPGELASMIRDIKSVCIMLGSGEKRPSDAEIENAKVGRKSLTAAAAIRKGDSFSNRNVSCKRPGTGASPMDYWDLVSRSATKDYSPDDLIRESK